MVELLCVPSGQGGALFAYCSDDFDIEQPGRKFFGLPRKRILVGKYGFTNIPCTKYYVLYENGVLKVCIN